MSDTELKREYVEMLEQENAALKKDNAVIHEANLQLKEQVKELCKGIDTVNNVGVGFRRENAELKERAVKLQKDNAVVHEANLQLKESNFELTQHNAELYILRDRLLAMVKELETDKNGVCPKCRNYCLTGHNANCSLGKLLAEIRKDGSNG